MDREAEDDPPPLEVDSRHRTTSLVPIRRPFTSRSATIRSI
jgi:hypothetical protein